MTSAVTTTAAANSSGGSGSPTPAGGSPTPAGTKLKPGGSAIVDYQPNFTNKPSYRLQVTIESIKLGSMSDFKNMSLSGVPRGSSPTYVRVTIKNLSGKAIGTSQNDPFNSIQALVDNQELDSATIGGYFADCPQPSTPNPLKAGQSFSACETFFTKGEATQIGYLGSSATLNSPVSWSP